MPCGPGAGLDACPRKGHWLGLSLINGRQTNAVGNACFLGEMNFSDRKKSSPDT
jgi:hypothetical protein